MLASGDAGDGGRVGDGRFLGEEGVQDVEMGAGGEGCGGLREDGGGGGVDAGLIGIEGVIDDRRRVQLGRSGSGLVSGGEGGFPIGGSGFQCNVIE